MLCVIESCKEFLAGGGAENLFIHGTDGFRCTAAVLGVDEEIRFQQDLAVQTVYIGVGMVASDQRGGAFHNLLREAEGSEHLSCGGDAFLFLQLSGSGGGQGSEC